LETLARFRRPPAADQIEAELAEITNADADHPSLGTVPSSWLTERRMGTAAIESGRYACVYSGEWLSYLRGAFEPELLRSGAILAGEMEFDLALLLSQNRSLTQRAATAIYALGFDGIFYQSRHGADLFNWALFEPFNLKDPIEAEIPFTDPDFQEALRRLDLNFDDMR
jgi:hypothetical protein